MAYRHTLEELNNCSREELITICSYLPVSDVSQSSQALRKSRCMRGDGLTTTELQV